MWMEWQMLFSYHHSLTHSLTQSIKSVNRSINFIFSREGSPESEYVNLHHEICKTPSKSKIPVQSPHKSPLPKKVAIFKTPTKATSQTRCKIPIRSPSHRFKQLKSSPSSIISPGSSPRKSKIPIHQNPPHHTPVKVPLHMCVICGKTATDLRHVHTAAGRKNQLQRLLHIYCDVSLTQGALCRADENKIMNLDEKVIALKTACKRTLSERSSRPGIKRGIHSPSISSVGPVTAKTLSTKPSPCSSSSRKTPKKQLFSSIAAEPSKVHVKHQKSVTDVHSKDDHHYHKAADDHRNKQDSISPVHVHVQQHSPIPSPADHLYCHSQAISLSATNVAADIASKQQVTPPQSQHIALSEKDKLLEAVQLGSTQCLAQHLVRNQQLSMSFVNAIQDVHDVHVKELQRQKHGNLSVLLKKMHHTAYLQLDSFNWADIVVEMQHKFPMFLKLAIGIMLPKEKRTNASEIQKILPRLGMIYAICIQNRVHYLSLVQPMMAAILTEGLCDVRVCWLSMQ